MGLVNRSLYRSCNAPAVREPSVKRGVLDAGAFGPLFDAQRLAIVRNEHIRAAIVALFFDGRPSTVSRLVATVVVDSPVKQQVFIRYL